MDLLKGALKVVGSAALGVGWVAAGIIRNAADAAGVDVLAELADSGVNASANGIKQIWNTEDNYDEIDDEDMEVSELERQKTRKRKAATRCREMASACQKAGDDEKYEMYMQRYEDLMEEVRMYEEEIAETKRNL